MVLLSIIRKNKLKERELRVLILGLDNSGKSSIVAAIKHGMRDKHNEHNEQNNTASSVIANISPTLGFEIFTLLHDG
jgi:ADP-ribosylation factor-like protein 2